MRREKKPILEHTSDYYLCLSVSSSIIRFDRDSAALGDWMTGARELINRWSQLSVSNREEVAVEQRRDLHLQSVVRTSHIICIKSPLCR